MSKFFIAAGILVILVLFTALIGPHFVDWTSYRSYFERQASDYIGRPVSIAGKVNVRLLPTPVVTFTDIRVGEADAPELEIEQFRAEIELAALLKGEVRIIQMGIERPLIHFDVANLDASSGGRAGAWRLDANRISLERLEVADGAASIVDSRNGRSWRMEAIDATVEADTLMGPGRATANLAFDGKPMSLSLAFGRVAGDSIVAKVSIRSPDSPLAVSLDGTYRFPGAAPASYAGTATLEGTPPKDAETRSPWADFRAAGKFELTPSELQLHQMQISYGGTERPLILEAAGNVDLGATPRFDATIGARQVDLDRTLGGGAEKPVTLEAALSALAEMLPALKLPPFPGALHLQSQGIVIGGSVVEAVGVDLTTGAAGWQVDRLAATLPGETRIDLEGTLSLAPAASFKGHARVTSKRPPAFASWWRGAVGSAGKIGRFAIDADLDLGSDGDQISNLVATTAAGTVEGSVGVRRFAQSGELFVNVDLAADRADLVEARALAELLAGKILGGGNIAQMTLSLRADVLSAGGIEAKTVVVEGGLDGGALNLRKLSIADLAGASLDASGNIRDPLGKPSGRIEASVRAADFTGAADFLASFAPENRLAQQLKSVAPALSPVNAEVSGEIGEGGGKLGLMLTGSFADTHVTLEADGSGSLDDPGSLAGKLTLHADGEDSAVVLRQIGLKPLPVHSAPLRLDATFDGALASGGKLALQGSVAGLDFEYAAQTSLRDGALALSGPVTATSADIDPLLLLAGAAVPGVGEGHAASLTGRLDYAADTASITLDKASFAGDAVAGALQAKLAPDIAISGALDLKSASVPFLVSLAAGTQPGVTSEGWSDKPFAAALPPSVGIDLTLGAASLDIGAPLPATDAKLGFSLSSGVVNVDLLDAGFAGGRLKGSVAATFHDGEADVSLRAGLAAGDLQALIWEGAGLPAASGKLDLSLQANGHGRSMSAIVAALGGTGSFSIDSGRLNALNGEALSAVMAAAEGDKEPDDQEARETFARLFGSGALIFGRSAGAFSVSDGIVSVPTVSLSDAATTVLASATVDLNALTLSSDWIVRAIGAGDEASQPFVQVHFGGPIADPERQIDVDPLLNRLRSRFLQRQLDALEAAQARERARLEQARQAAAEQRDREQFEGLHAPPVADPQPEATPTPPSAPAAPIGGAAQLPPSLLNPAPLTGTDASPVEIGPDLPPLEPVPPPPRRQTQRPPPVAPAAPVPLVPVVPPPSFDSKYRTLPNGTIVKIR